jgi:tetrahydromethanopterin S-methyltransferase subunit F
MSATPATAVEPAPRLQLDPNASPAAREMAEAFNSALDAQQELAERHGYITGVRAGRLAGIAWGVLIGMLVVIGSTKLGMVW